MPERNWIETDWDAVDIASNAFLEALRPLVPAPVLMVSDSEEILVVVSIGGLRTVADLDLVPTELDGDLNVAFLVAPPHGEVDLEETAAGLRADAIAISDDVRVAGDAPDLGSVSQSIDPRSPASFRIFDLRRSIGERLTRGAPIGQNPDDLGGRADWFKKRR